MKKWMALLLALTLVFALGACSAKAPAADDASAASEEPAASAEPEASETAEEPVKLNVYMLAGPTGMGAVNMMAASDAGELAQEYEFTVASAPDEVVGKIANSEADIAAISTNLAAKLYAKTEGGVTVLGVVGAVTLPLYDITDFLYFIGSVFAPMIAIQIADFFILKKAPCKRAFDIKNLVIWLVGFVIYRLLMRVDIVVGNTLPDMLVTIVLCLAADKLLPRKKA